MGSILDRACRTSRNLPLARIGQFDRTNNGVRTSHGLKGERGRIFRKLTDLLPLTLFASAPKYSLVRRYSSGNHAKSCYQGWRYHSHLSALHPGGILMAVTFKPQGFALTSHTRLKQERSTYQR